MVTTDPSAIIVEQSQSQLQTFFDELKNGTSNYRTVASLSSQVAQEYRGRCVLELLQNAHDALADHSTDGPQRISFVLTTSPKPELLIANSGQPFQRENFDGICQLGQSPKSPNESVGNKGLGFRSVLEVCTRPEIWSSSPKAGGAAFDFRFDPDVGELVVASIRDLEVLGLEAKSPFDSRRALVDWTPDQLKAYREGLAMAHVDACQEAKESLSPYMLPLPIEHRVGEVDKLLRDGHATVIRLQLDGGRQGTEAIHSVMEQLEDLDAHSLVFLSKIDKLIIEIDGERRTLTRTVEAEPTCRIGERTTREQIIISSSGPELDGGSLQRFHVWNRTFGGEPDPEQMAQVAACTEHLPNRWPEVNRVTVGVAVEEAEEPSKGVFVIFLPTDVTTGTGAYINAPFYGSLGRDQIQLDDSYNGLLLRIVLDLILDVVADLVSGDHESWRARSVIDLLASTAVVGGRAWRLIDRLKTRAAEIGCPLDEQDLILCDRGWQIPSQVRFMPHVPAESPVRCGAWRKLAKFEAVSDVLDSRTHAVEELLDVLGGSSEPLAEEWTLTIESMARAVQGGSLEVSWDAFLDSLVKVLPDQFKNAPSRGDDDPLAKTCFLPDQHGRLHRASDRTKVFFRQVRGAGDAADSVGDVPESLKHHVAFLHPDVQTLEGAQRSNSDVHRFLDSRFVRTFRREDLLRDVVQGALPELPAVHGTSEADLCADLLSWALRIVGEEPPETLIRYVRPLPVPCLGGWFPMEQAVFGPGFECQFGDQLWVLADELPGDLGDRIRESALLPADDPRWPTSLEGRAEFLARAGVARGLRLQSASAVSFRTQGYGFHQLPSDPPAGIPKEAWNRWCRDNHSDAEPLHDGEFEYLLSGVWVLPEVYLLPSLSPSGTDAFWRLVLASFEHWPDGWEVVSMEKVGGHEWSTDLQSPLMHWLATEPWLLDDEGSGRLVCERWLVDESLMRGHAERFAHLAPLSGALVRELHRNPHAEEVLSSLGLNIYPCEDERIGPELLEALAMAWRERRVPIQRFDVFLGQVRDGWRHLDEELGLPAAFLVRDGKRSFSLVLGDELHEVYLPDHRGRTQSLIEHGKPVLEMHARDAGRLAEVLVEHGGLRSASDLAERVYIDGALWVAEEVVGSPLEETRYAWLPAVLLTIAAHGGARPIGAATKAWREASDRLRRARLLECETVLVEMTDGERVMASSEPESQWLSGDVLAVRCRGGSDYERLAGAAQDMLGRQDLLKDLRLVLGSLSDREEPTLEQKEVALEKAEIDASAFLDIRQRWTWASAMLVDRIRPLLRVLEVSDAGLEAAAAKEEGLGDWLTRNVKQWAAEDLLSSARRSRDDAEMGRKAWEALGDVAQLPAWNRALRDLGDYYVTVRNLRADEQAAGHLEEVTPFLRALARHLAIASNDSGIFLRLERATREFAAPDEWADGWWEVPASAVLGVLKEHIARVLCAEEPLHILDSVDDADGLRTALCNAGIEVDPNPYETASKNKVALEGMVSCVHDLYSAWIEIQSAETSAAEEQTKVEEFDANAYLVVWSEDDLLQRALLKVGSPEFCAAAKGCRGLEDLRTQLALSVNAVESHRGKRAQEKVEVERKKRTFDVAGSSFEIGTDSYLDLFDRIGDLTMEEGPNAGQDEFTPLADVPSSTRKGGGDGKPGKTAHRRVSPGYRELVGTVGEMYAYRYLVAEFGRDVVTRDAWVSEIRLKAMPIVAGEVDKASDGHGCDFRFRHRSIEWHVEVKSTAGEDSQFDLGISEIRAASHLSGMKAKRWRILRISKALSGAPTFEWLPNPFDDEAKGLFRLTRTGMTVTYSRKET